MKDATLPHSTHPPDFKLITEVFIYLFYKNPSSSIPPSHPPSLPSLKQLVEMFGKSGTK